MAQICDEFCIYRKFCLGKCQSRRIISAKAILTISGRSLARIRKSEYAHEEIQVQNLHHYSMIMYAPPD